MTTLQTAHSSVSPTAIESMIPVSASGSLMATAPLIYLLEDDPLMAKCLALSCRQVLSTPPKNPKNPESPKIPKTPETPETPKEPETPKTPEAPEIRTFTDVISAMAAFDQGLPDLILLDIMLSGPDGFTFLNELMSYSDTATIPVILITSLELRARNLEHYGVREILSKETLTPASLAAAVRRYV